MLVNGGTSSYLTSRRYVAGAVVDTRNSSPIMSYGRGVKGVSPNKYRYLTAPHTITRQWAGSESPDSAVSSFDSSPKSQTVDSDSGGSGRSSSHLSPMTGGPSPGEGWPPRETEGSDSDTRPLESRGFDANVGRPIGRAGFPLPPRGVEPRWRRSLEDVWSYHKESGTGPSRTSHEADPIIERFGIPYEIGTLSTPNSRYSLAYTSHPTLAMYPKLPQTAVRCLTSDLPLKKRFRRAGIIPYAYFQGTQHYLMAIDSKYQELSDFGGQVKHRESFIDAVCREFYEETLGFFDYTSEESKKAVLQSSIAIHDEKETLILFQEIQCQDPLAVIEEYQHRVSKVGDQENSGMLWVPHDVFVCLYQSKEAVKVSETQSYPKMYCRISDLISIVGGLFEEEPDSTGI